MAQNKIHMPGAFGGLMRYDEGYASRFMLSPAGVIAFIIAIVTFILVLKLLFPVTAPTVTQDSGAPFTPGNFILSMLGS